jgi:diaminopimelate epimerase
MRIRFTKMQGAGNDFVVLDETRAALGLGPAQYRFLADRHFGVGADQILSVRRVNEPGVDFGYAIHNADGAEVEHCGNGARCFVRYVREHGLFDGDLVRVRTVNNLLELRMLPDGRVTVDMGEPRFGLAEIPFEPRGLKPVAVQGWSLWDLDAGPTLARVAVLSMGNPHAVLLVDDVDQAPVAELGPRIERHPCFPNRVNAGFLQVLDRAHARLRVFERGVGETLACGTGACAAVVAGIRLGLLDAEVEVATRGGSLGISWSGMAGRPADAPPAPAPVRMTGPATTVFEGEIDIPDIP